MKLLKRSERQKDICGTNQDLIDLINSITEKNWDRFMLMPHGEDHYDVLYMAKHAPANFPMARITRSEAIKIGNWIEDRFCKKCDLLKGV